MRDLQAKADKGSFTDSYTVNVPSHGTATLKIVGAEPHRPRGTAFLSDLTPIYAANGLGPVERDHANGGSEGGDGPDIKIRATTFAKGMGMSAPAAIIYRLGGKCTSFSAQVGVDDSSTAGQGTVRFKVFADGEMLFDSAEHERHGARDGGQRQPDRQAAPQAAGHQRRRRQRARPRELGRRQGRVRAIAAPRGARECSYFS